MLSKYKKVLSEIDAASQIILFHHVNPDYDCFSSVFAFYQWLSDNYPKISLSICLDRDNLKSAYFQKYISSTKIDLITLNSIEKKKYLGIVFDVCQYDRVFQNDVLQICQAKIVFDHHDSRSDIFDIKVINPIASSTTEMLHHFFSACENKFLISKSAAHFLYYGLITDTGRFLYLNAESSALKTGYQLVRLGAEPLEIYTELYRTNAAAKRLMGHILSNFIIKQNIAYIILNHNTLEHFKIKRSLAAGYVNLLSQIDTVDVHFIVTEDRDNACWSISLRSKQIHINKFAIRYGGGGHKLAAGCKLKKLQDVQLMITELIIFCKADGK